MSRFSVCPERLFDRPWRAGHPFGPRCGRVRRWGAVLLLAVLCAVIYGYAHLTNAARVRGMAESALSDLVGGRVTVGRATLSLFEGLRLDDVQVYVDADGAAPDALLFSAQTFVVKYDPQSMLRGRLAVTQIIAQKPHVHLTENADARAWNWHRLGRARARRRRPAVGPPARPNLPEILLRNARVEIGELRGGRRRTLGYLAIDGQLTQSADGERYGFELQSRGVSEVGPFASGSVGVTTGHVSARLMDFGFGQDLRSMLPAEVRRWWERHELSGRIDIPTLTYAPARDGAPARFTVETEIVDGVSLTIPAEAWMGAEQIALLNRTRDGLALMRGAYRAAGVRVRRPAASGAAVPAAAAGTSLAAAAAAATTPDGREPAAGAAPPVAAIDRLASVFEPTPVTLRNVKGRFVFTERGIDFQDVNGRVDANGVNISGKIHGYGVDAPLSMRMTSFEHENLTIPESPGYVRSLPPQVRELYDQLRPQGTGRLLIEVVRPTAGARPEIDGRLDILNGRFLYAKFPYPIREATGTVLFGRDPRTGADRVEIQHVRGRGLADGPNRDTYVTVDGRISPLGPTAGVHIRVRATGASSEPALMAAFPPEVRDALRIFDAPGAGLFPRFRGNFACTVVRPEGLRTPWSFDTDVKLDDAAGVLEAFPYPLDRVTGDLKIRTGFVDIANLAMIRGDARLRVDGRVGWGDKLAMTPAMRRTRATELKIAVKNLSADRDLLAALPGDRRAWLEKLGVGGKLDVEGRLFDDARVYETPRIAAAPPAGGDAPATRPAVPAGVPLDYDLALTLHDGTFWPAGGTFALSDVAGRMRLGRERLDLLDLRGRRGAAEVAAAGHVEWGNGRPTLRLRATAGAMPLDGALYALLPGPARRAWDEVQPQGTVDAEVDYEGELAGGGGVTRPGPALAIRDSLKDAANVPALAPSPSPASGALAAASDAVLAPGAATDAAATDPASAIITATPAPPGPSPETATPSPGTSPAPPEVPGRLKVVLRPRDLAVTLRSMPYRLENLTGTVTATPERIVLEDVTGRHGDGTIRVSGNGALGGPRPVWTLRLGGSSVAADPDFRAALPTSLGEVMDSLKLTGRLGFDFSRLVYQSGEGPAFGPQNVGEGGARVVPVNVQTPPAVRSPGIGPDTRERQTAAPAASVVLTPAGQPATSPAADVDFAGTVTLDAGGLDVGVPLADVAGRATLEGSVRGGRLAVMEGALAADAASLTGRPMRNFRADLLKPAEKAELRLTKMSGELAGGELAGGVLISYPDDGPSRYALNLVVRNADVRELARASDKDVRGQLTASLSLEGAWGAEAARRGRGDVVVTGRGMYDVPLVLGLLQVTNLALPLSSPFNEATARYSVEGQRIAFENVSLRSDTMVMSGDGHLDFGTKKVSLTFVTDNAGGLRLPFFNELWQGARQELLRIHVRGTVQEPKVSAGMMGTFTTTVDEVFKGEPPKPERARGKRR